MYKNIFSIIVGFSLFINVYAQEDHINFKHITNIDGLSSNYIKAIFEDSKGLIWMATDDGVNVYDGTTIKYIYKEREVRNIVEDKKNSNLYLSTKGGVMLFEREKHKYSSFSVTTQKGEILQNLYTSAININDKNELFLGNINKLYIVNPSRTDFEIFDNNKNSAKKVKRINTILFRKNGEILIGTPEGIVQFNRQKKQFIPVLNDYTNFSVKNIIEDSKGNIWICTENKGIYCVEEGDLNGKVSYYGYENGFLPNNRAIDMVEFDTDNYYIINVDGGLVHLNKKTNTTKYYLPDAHNPKSINSKAISAILKDSKKNIWLGTLKNGVNLIDYQSKKFQHYYMNFKPNGLITNNIRSFFQDAQGNIWVGTDAPGSLNKFNRKNGTFETYKMDTSNPNALHGDFVLCIEEIDDDHLILGTLKKGVEIFNKKTGKFNHLLLGKNDKGNRAYAIKKDIKGNIWVAGLNELLKYNPTTNSLKPIIDITNICYIQQADDNHLWLSTFFDGLYYFDINTFKYKQYKISRNDTIKETIISSNSVTVVRNDSKGNTWIGTSDGGLNFKKKDSDIFTHINIKEGLAHKVVSDILVENDSTIWISSVSGLSKYNVNKKTFRHYNAHDGLQDNQFGAYTALKTKNGEMYFGGRNGFNVFNPKDIVDNPIVPKVMFTDFKLFNKSVLIDTLNSPLSKHISETKTLTVNHKQSIMTFSFVGISYSSPEKNQYAYILEGFEKEWNYIGHKNEATYTNLPPGNYTLRVKASNNDRKWNEEGVSLKLIILPPWWSTWWFKTIVFIAVIGGGLLFFIIRMRQMKEQQKELEQKVYERTKDLQEANIIMEERQEEISQQNEELEVKQNELISKHEEIELKNTVLKDQNENIKASITYAKTIQNAILPTPQQMNNAFDGFVVFRPKDIVSGDFYWMSQIDENTCIIAAVDCTGHGVPGAFMSMIGSRMLSTIVNEQKILSPKDILSKMNEGIQRVLKQNTSENDDGMDVCICKIEKKEGFKITYSGAKRPLFYFDAKSNEIIRIKGSLNSIGGNYHLDDHPYINTVIVPSKDDMIYLTSDGYLDQNNTSRKSFGTQKFNELIKNIAHLNVDEQKIKMDEALDNYMVGTKQRDDITIIGIKINE